MKCVYPNGMQLPKEQAIAFEEGLVHRVKQVWLSVKEMIISTWETIKKRVLYLVKKCQAIKRNQMVKRRSQMRIIKSQVTDRRPRRRLARSCC
ncbi:hypothetical protein BTR22_18570 [Alkalihalophilus pseudofirmus]|nr:hypothetical protein BTR22_18570 [Alkalihalophilus pseudofirmus]